MPSLFRHPFKCHSFFIFGPLSFSATLLPPHSSLLTPHSKLPTLLLFLSPLVTPHPSPLLLGYPVLDGVISVLTLTGRRNKPHNSRSNLKHLLQALMLRCVLFTPSSAISTAAASAVLVLQLLLLFRLFYRPF